MLMPATSNDKIGQVYRMTEITLAAEGCTPVFGVVNNRATTASAFQFTVELRY